MKKLFARMQYELEAYWRSDASTIHGVVISLCGLAGTTVGANALETLGVPAEAVKIAAALAVVGGAILMTPRKESEE